MISLEAFATLAALDLACTLMASFVMVAIGLAVRSVIDTRPTSLDSSYQQITEAMDEASAKMLNPFGFLIRLVGWLGLFWVASSMGIVVA